MIKLVYKLHNREELDDYTVPHREVKCNIITFLKNKNIPF